MAGLIFPIMTPAQADQVARQEVIPRLLATLVKRFGRVDRAGLLTMAAWLDGRRRHGTIEGVDFGDVNQAALAERTVELLRAEARRLREEGNDD